MSTPANENLSRDDADPDAGPAEEARPRRGRRGAIIGVALALILAVAAVVVVYTVPVFAVRTIEVTGAARVADEDVRAATGVAEGTNLLRVDTADAAAGVVANPWVDQATVDRSLPSTLVVEVVERTPVAFIDTPEGTMLIDGTGHPIVAAEPPAEAVHITGAAADDEEALAGAVEIAGSLNDELRTQVATVEAGDQYTYTLLLGDGRRVFWGEAIDNENKALALETVVQREGGEWNISNPSLVTVR